MEMGRKVDGGTYKWSRKCTAFSVFYCKNIKVFFIANSSYSVIALN